MRPVWSPGRAGAEALTLTEVLVALALFVVVSAAVLATLPGLLSQGRRASQDHSVVVGAKRYLEGVRAQFLTPAGFAAPLPAAPDPSTLGGWTCEATSRDELSGPDPDLGPGSLRVDIRRVTLECRSPDSATNGTAAAQSFSVAFGRPP